MDFVMLAQQCAPQVAVSTLAAVVRTESGYRPWAIGVNGKAKLARQPVSREEAIATAKWLIARGYNIDMGLGQINSANLKRYNVSVEEVFEPCRNLNVAGEILKANYQAARQKGHAVETALYAALSAYNTGSMTRGWSNGYVQKVVNNAGADVPPIPLKIIAPKHKKKAAVEKPTAGTIENSVAKDTPKNEVIVF